MSGETRHREVVAPVADIAAMPPRDPKQQTGPSISDEVGGASRTPEAEEFQPPGAERFRRSATKGCLGAYQTKSEYHTAEGQRRT